VDDGWIGLGTVDDRIAVLSSENGVDWNNIDAAVPPPTVPEIGRYQAGLQDLIGLGSLTSHGGALVLAGSATDGIWGAVDGGDTWEQSRSDTGRVEMTVSEAGFVGVSAGLVIFSADGVSWAEFAPAMDFQDVAAVGGTLVALASDGVYTCTPTSGDLAQTGANTTPFVAAAVTLLLAGLGAHALSRRRPRSTA
jgi:LPXTG-motif cell wall-anchored protein